MALSLPADLRTLYLEVLKHPTLIEELSGYQKSKLGEYAEQESMRATRTIVDMMDGDPNYPYPEEYRNGREVEYLLSKHSPTYWDSQRVLFLLRIPAASTLTAPSPIVIPASGATTKEKKVLSFPSYIKEEYREKLLPYLKKEYASCNPQVIAFMLIALQDLTALTILPKVNETALHKALTAFLGDIGSRQALNKNLSNFRSASSQENAFIEVHRNSIAKHME